MKTARTRPFVLLPLFALMLVGGPPVVEALENPLVIAPQSVEPGGAASLALYLAGGIRRASAQLVDSAGRAVTEAPAFPVSVGLPSRPVFVLLGVPTTVPPGSYRLEIRGEGDAGSTFAEHRIITIEARTFRHEKLPLNRSLSELREVATPRKIAEARELERILSGFDPAALYETAGFIMPIAHARPTSRFGDRRRYEYSDGSVAGTIHSGVDLAAPAGTPVVAAGAGRVMFAGTWLVSGNTVVLEHLPGVYSLYFHMATLAVGSGDKVSKGERIGTVGATGLATGPHLHWEVRIRGVAVDPQSLVGGGLVDFENIRHTITKYVGRLAEGG